jgi:hypothetical protein
MTWHFGRENAFAQQQFGSCSRYWIGDNDLAFQKEHAFAQQQFGSAQGLWLVPSDPKRTGTIFINLLLNLCYNHATH